MQKILSHPITQRTRRILRRIASIAAVILAVAFVTTLTVDLGPRLRGLAERSGSNYIERPMHIGRLGVHLWLGEFVVEDFVIEGLTPQSRPFLTAKRIEVSMPWSSLFSRRVVLDEIEMTDWTMYTEVLPGGKHNFPRFTRNTPRRPSAWTTTLSYVRAHRGEFVFEDHETPWSTVARNLDVVVARPTSEYRGQATFSNGTVQIQKYEPMRADMTTSFRIVGGQIVLDKIDLVSDGARTALTGVIESANWPEQTYQIRSHMDFARMRELFFARDAFTLSGEGDFVGTFHLFKEQVNGRTRTGRELKGTFSGPDFAVNEYRFPNLAGSVLWVPEKLEVTKATAGLYGGKAEFSYLMTPLGVKGVRPNGTFDVKYTGVDLATLTNALELKGLRLAGSASGRNLLVWPIGQFAGRRGEGEVSVDAPPGVAVQARELGVVPAGVPDSDEAPFSNHTPREPVPIAGTLAYTYAPDDIAISRSRVSTPTTYIEFDGRTNYGDDSRIPFHVTSTDWQDSDRLLAGLMTAFGAPTTAIPISGHGTFDGTMFETFRRPRIEGDFAGEQMRAFDVNWGRIAGAVVIENSYATVRDVTVGTPGSEIVTSGKYSLGFPRRDGGDEIDALVRVNGRPVKDLRHAFGLDDYEVDGLLSGEFRVLGKYQQPLGFGTMTIDQGVAYGESFESATGGVRLEGTGVRLDNIAISKGGVRGTGAAYVAWETGTYSFQFNVARIPIAAIDMVRSDKLPPLSGFVDFTAGGSGTFDEPRYDVRGTVRDFYIGDEGLGQVVGTLAIAGETMTVRLEAASPRLAVSGSGQIALTDEMRAEMNFNVSDTSLDPYIRVFQPDLPPYTTAVVSGSIHVVGSLTNVDDLRVDTSVDALDLRFFDYRLRNESPIKASMERFTLRVNDMRLVGEDTELTLSGALDLHNQSIAAQVGGAANLAVLQGFVPNIRSSGRGSIQATVTGPMRSPGVSGAITLTDGRLRAFSLPHALENVTGVVRFDTRGVTLDELTGRLGGGPVQFGGRIDIDRYRPGRMDVTMRGEDMRLRFPEGMTSLVDADLSLQGTQQGSTLSGTINVRNAVYRRAFDGGGGLLDLNETTAGALGGTTAAGGFVPTVPLRYDVHILVPSTLRIENRVARLDATADLQLRGTYDKPLLFGRAEIERGDVNFEGRRYLVTRGSIDFNNPTRIEPFFDVETETRVRVPAQTYRVTVRAVGTLDRFTPEFTSDPPLPEVDVLGLLFSDATPGLDVEARQYSSITPQEQLLRQRATRALTGALTAEVGRVVEQTLGVDTFQLTPSLIDPNAQSSRLDPAARLTIGKRLSDRIYLTYSRSLSSSTRDQIILLEYDQTDRFSWILSRNEDRTYALDVRVRHVF
ncbi:MAG: translocation/assembly module TamB domain-containing protein [Vicinamibacterales bacterium]